MKKNLILVLVVLCCVGSVWGGELVDTKKADEKPSKPTSIERDADVPGNYLESLMLLEGPGRHSKKTRLFAQSIFEALGNPASNLSSSELLEGAKSMTDKKIQDIQFVFGIMALSLEGRDEEAFAHLKQFKPELSIQDEEPAHSGDILGFAYAWLINNTGVTVPCWFIQKYPSVFYNKTPYWASSYDAYFRVCTPENWRFSTIPAFKELQGAINDAYNPGGCWLGTMANCRHKNLQIQKGLLANAPDYYLKNVSVYDSSKWLDYWQYLGTYNFNVSKRIHKAVKQFQPELIDMLTKSKDIGHSDAEKIAKKYLNNMIACAIGVGYEKYEKRINSLNIHDGKIRNSSPDDWECYAPEIVGGYLLYERPVEHFLDYVRWLKGHSEWNVIHSLMNTAAAINANALAKILELDIPYPDTWGAFNKSPLLYAVQYNNYDSYLLLKNIAAMDTLTLHEEDQYYCDMPQIGKRNVLTYAAENATLPLLHKVIEDFGEKYGSMTDTANNNLLAYLYRNKHLSREYVYKTLIKFGENMLLAQYFIDQNDGEHAIPYLQLAAKENNPDALFYELGVYAQKNKQYSDAVSYFKKTLDLEPDNNFALFKIARMYMHGWGIAKDESTAFQMMKKVADEEDKNYRLRAIAEANVGIYFLRGQGVKQSKVEAEQYLRKAVYNGEKKILDFLQSIVQSEKLYADFIKEILNEKQN